MGHRYRVYIVFRYMFLWSILYLQCLKFKEYSFGVDHIKVVKWNVNFALLSKVMNQIKVPKKQPNLCTYMRVCVY